MAWRAGVAMVLVTCLAVATGLQAQTPPPARPDPSAAPPAPVTVAVVGDSLAGDYCRGLRRVLDRVPGYEVLCWAHPSSGLTRIDFFDWDATLRDYLSTTTPDIAIVGMGANDAQRIVVDRAMYDLDDPEWSEIYGGRVDSMVGALKGAGVEVVWVGVPAASSRRYDGKLALIDAIYRARATAGAVAFLDLRARTLDASGRYVATLPDKSGRDRPARQSDGIHFSADGEVLVGCMLLDYLPGGPDVRSASQVC
jgi:hypothetical protein